MTVTSVFDASTAIYNGIARVSSAALPGNDGKAGAAALLLHLKKDPANGIMTMRLR